MALPDKIMSSFEHFPLPSSLLSAMVPICNSFFSGSTADGKGVSKGRHGDKADGIATGFLRTPAERGDAAKSLNRAFPPLIRGVGCVEIVSG